MIEKSEGVEDVRVAAEACSARDTPISRPAKIPRQPALRPTHDGVEIVPMTAEQHESAVFTLATLIAHWEQIGCPAKPPDSA
ncbi:hypothetical protein [Frankia sp. AiPa1]|uniref:hypothetical protein n=1 Tax=Frankia sp. AiPa1 TaxID=573492 RepID=UPI00202AC47B|nr:hypothetical protein [Frankia sp. AiPa1]MCL9759266.1 hypothetical protein [Frankia sp. AiPa1]